MHAPTLLLEILELRLQLTLCDPHQTAEIQGEIDSRMDTIRLMCRIPIERIKAVCDSRYPQFVAEQKDKGNLVQKSEQSK